MNIILSQKSNIIEFFILAVEITEFHVSSSTENEGAVAITQWSL